MRQWQMRTLTGSPSALNRTAPHRHPPSLIMVSPLCRSALIRRAAAGNVEHRAGGEGAVLRGQPRHHRGEFLYQNETPLRNLRKHEVDVLLRQLVEDRGLGSSRGHRVDGDIVSGEFLAERLCQSDQ